MLLSLHRRNEEVFSATDLRKIPRKFLHPEAAPDLLPSGQQGLTGCSTVSCRLYSVQYCVHCTVRLRTLPLPAPQIVVTRSSCVVSSSSFNCTTSCPSAFISQELLQFILTMQRVSLPSHRKRGEISTDLPPLISKIYNCNKYKPIFNTKSFYLIGKKSK